MGKSFVRSLSILAVMLLAFSVSAFAKNAAVLKVFVDYANTSGDYAVVGATNATATATDCVNLFVNLLDEDGDVATAGPAGEDLNSFTFSVASSVLGNNTSDNVSNSFAAASQSVTFGGKPSGIAKSCYNQASSVSKSTTSDTLTISAGTLKATGTVALQAPNAAFINVQAMGNLTAPNLSKIGSTVDIVADDATNGVQYRYPGNTLPFAVVAGYGLTNSKLGFTPAPNLEGKELTVSLFSRDATYTAGTGTALATTTVTMASGMATGSFTVTKGSGNSAASAMQYDIRVASPLSTVSVLDKNDRNLNSAAGPLGAGDVKYYDAVYYANESVSGIIVSSAKDASTAAKNAIKSVLVADATTANDGSIGGYVWMTDAYGNPVKLCTQANSYGALSATVAGNSSSDKVFIAWDKDNEFQYKDNGMILFEDAAASAANDATVGDITSNLSRNVTVTCATGSSSYTTTMTAYGTEYTADATFAFSTVSDASAGSLTAGIGSVEYVLEDSAGNPITATYPYIGSSYTITAYNSSGTKLSNAIGLSTDTTGSTKVTTTLDETKSGDTVTRYSVKVRFFKTSVSYLKIQSADGDLREINNDANGYAAMANYARVAGTTKIPTITNSGVVDSIKETSVGSKTLKYYTNSKFYAVAGPVQTTTSSTINKLFKFKADESSTSAASVYYVADAYGNKVNTSISCTSSLGGSIIPDTTSDTYYAYYSDRALAGQTDSVTCVSGNASMSFDIDNIVKLAEGFSVTVVGPKFANAFSSTYDSSVYPGSFVLVQVGVDGVLETKKSAKVAISGIDGALMYDKNLTSLSGDISLAAGAFASKGGSSSFLVYVPTTGTLTMTVSDKSTTTPFSSVTYDIPVAVQDKTAPTYEVTTTNGGLSVVFTDDNGIDAAATSVAIFDTEGAEISGTTVENTTSDDGKSYTVAVSGLTTGTYNITLNYSDTEGNTGSKYVVKDVTFEEEVSGALTEPLAVSADGGNLGAVEVDSSKPMTITPSMAIADGDTPESYLAGFFWNDVFFIFNGTELGAFTGDFPAIDESLVVVDGSTATFNLLATAVDLSAFAGTDFEILLAYAVDGAYKWGSYTLTFK